MGELRTEFNTDEKSGTYIVYDNLAVIGELNFIYKNPIEIVITSIQVNQNYRGKGIAKQLFDQTITFAEKKELTVSATCSYAVVQLSRKNRKM
ncbi:MAG: GNAT family N-acetyltransferase [Bacilli bacterium]